MKNRISLQVWLPAAAFLAALLSVTLLLPGMLVKRTPAALPSVTVDSLQQGGSDRTSLPLIPVYLSREQKVEQVPLETYVRNVVAAEMPAQFELEALKAQAIASRTYIVKRWMDHDTSQVPAEGALVTDTTAHQAYVTVDEMKRNWGETEFDSRLDKLNRAVNETAGLIITYDHKPIQASFFSTSNGYTENSEDYWRDYIPYLRSVPSPWDKELSPKFTAKTTFALKEFASRLGITDVSALARSGGLKIVSTTEGHRIKTVTIGGKAFTGREVREKLQLNSSQFTWKLAGASIELTTYGYGHGVGMSQWGANGMAKEGKNAAAIIQYYYQGVKLEQISSLP
ncbi:stage II sporulation protein D [Paenibacillus hodogayensis]|uniref:Stage II sporulation protein D n=1 Tax=Paenibacillus hodogayensis TaxID=279208 RepID=A0ABV5W7G5_9BACL